MGGCISIQISCDQVLNRVGSCLCGEGNHVRNLEKNYEALEKAMVELKATRDDVLTEVQREEAKGQRRLNRVQVWLTSVQTIENHFDDLNNTRTLELQRLCVFGVCSKNLKSSFRYGRKVSLMLKEVGDLKSNGVFEVVAAEPPSMRCVVEERPLQPVIVGQETMLERAWNWLMDDETGIMGLYGMGGVGKTTLLTQINNKFCEAVEGFQIVIWVVVSSDLRVEKIQDDIAKKLGRHGEEWNRKDKIEKVTDIHAHMKNKKFVLLLDDIWRKVDLTEIGIPSPTRENGCKVVFTTRSREVCGHMGVDDPMEVQCLTNSEAWNLFEKKVGPLTLKSHPGILEQARKVAEKCRGLPLALNVIGETMSSKRTIQEWHHAVQVLNLYAADFSGMDDQILPILKYSYDNLRGDKIKSCFQYCSLFPEDYLIEKEKLIDYWICEGFISEKKDRERMVNQGYGIIGTLVRSCLLLEEGSNKSKVKMHDVVREMALWISSDLGKNRDKCIVRAGVGLCEVPEVEQWNDVERMSLMNNKIESISASPKCPKLTTLFLQENRRLGSISDEFFMCMPKLVVLDLSQNNGVLDRSQNNGIYDLPEGISELVSLKYLDLSGTMISRLPVCFRKLKKLMHLYLEDMPYLQSISGISYVSNLRTLALLSCSQLNIVREWQQLLFLNHLQVLTIDIASKLVLEKLFFSHMGRCFQKVVIKNLGKESFGILDFPLILRSLKGPCFPSLSYVTIEGCGLKDLTWLLLAPNLIHLSLKSLSKLEEVVSIEKAYEMEVQGIIPFGKLETLLMSDLPEVKSIYWTPLTFPCLREMYIDLCPNLAKLPLDSKSVAEVEKFVIKYQSRNWIEGVKWEDEDTRLRFLPSRRICAVVNHQTNTLNLHQTSLFCKRCDCVLESEFEFVFKCRMGGCISIQRSGDSVFNHVGSCLRGEGKHIRNLEKNLETLEKTIRVVKARRYDVLRRVKEEEDKGQQRLNEVKVWLTSVQTIENHFDDLNSTRTRELQRLCLFGVSSKTLKSSSHYGRRVSLMLKEVENLISNGVFEVVAAELPAKRCIVEERPLQPVIFGQETMLEKAWNRLMNDETQAVGLCGIGGVGKTTLLTQINNKFCDAADGVQIVIWVEVSGDLRVEKIQDDIAEKLGLHGEEWDRKYKRYKAHDIHARMKNKKFVLLLDNIWREVDLAEIGIPLPTRENGCKVVFTTRSREVCSRMGVDDPMEVHCLTDSAAWDLFKKKVGSLTLKSHPGIHEHARKVAEKCRGLPLALNVIGETMSCKRTIKEWDLAVEVLNSYAADFAGIDDQILRILKYSYDDLKDDQIKSCFKYCSLFPEDYLIEKEKLIDYWICEGLISENEDRERRVNQGYEIIGILVRSYLLLEEGRNKSKVKMHDVVREMSLWISSDLGKNREKCITRAGVGLSKVPKVEKWSTVERMSLMSNNIEEISGSPECPKLTTLFLQENMPLARISGGFFKCMPKLVVLDLSDNYSLDRLPEEISELVSLKYLDLSRTDIWELPVGLWKLKRLIHLYLERMKNLESIDGISTLSSLRTLKLLGSYRLQCDKRSWEELSLLKHLEVLTIEIGSNPDLEKLFFSQIGMRCIQKAVIRDIFYFQTDLRSLKGPCFLSLSHVSIRNGGGIKDLTWLLCAPNLIELHLVNLELLEEVVNIEKAKKMQVQGIIPFAKLETLVMSDLPEVKSIYWIPLPFPCLREMFVEQCQKLRKLPVDSRSVAEVERFVIQYAPGNWIGKVEWEDEATRLRFLPSRRIEENPGRHVGFR
ncbi:unnamed protein product [Eruca vesicaria subsp. sativa]|uniref:AAA+ ATPase domain-containing protein n=1 Tax=Eruca vesicaria subsp. sativa TaxID=29727 RepID=A0ABC8LK76_ERUVS|nr:unnamed protein product [Eruca vesicaria subsp. sativa]